MLMRLCALGLLAFANASPAAKRGTVSFQYVTSGEYTIVNCGGNVTLIRNLLHRLRSSLFPVIQDASSLEPSPAYTAFFKDATYAPFVSALFTNVTTGVALTPPAPYSIHGGPTLMCVTAPEQFVFQINGRNDAYNDCLANPTTKARYIGFDPPKQYIILCPSFFTSTIASVPPPNTCLTFNAAINRFTGNGKSFWLYKIWVLLDMITHYYLYTSTGSADIANTNDVNRCVRLGPKDSSWNVNNYIFYAASVVGLCREFPTTPDYGRETLEIDIEDPSDDGPDYASPAAVTFNATDLELGVVNTTSTP